MLILESTDAERMAIMSELAKVSDQVHRDINPQFYPTLVFKRLIRESEPIAADIQRNPRIDLKGGVS